MFGAQRAIISNVPIELRAQAELELRRRNEERYGPARRTLEGFIRATKRNMVWNWFLIHLCSVLDQFLEDVLAGLSPRVMVIAPPRHGKTETVSRRFPAYVLGRFPEFHVIAASYAAPLAARINRDVQRVIDDQEYQKIFPNTRLNTKNIATLSGTPLRNSQIFEIVKHLGSYRGAGIGQGITGMGFNIGLIDDPLQDAAQANSEPERESQWEWYEQVFYSRAEPLSGILLIMTRWHEDDLAGRLLHKMQFEGGDKWKVVHFPAIAEEDELIPGTTDQYFRRKDEALHPSRYPVEVLLQRRAVMGSYAFGALYQGNPTPKGGGILKREDFRFFRRAEIETTADRPVFFEMLAMSVDAAFKDTINASYVVIQVWGRRGIRHYLLGQIRERLTFTRTIERMKELRDRFAPDKGYPLMTATLIEDKANGPAIIDVLSKRVPGVIAIEPIGSKEARAEAAAPLIEAGNVLIPHPDEEPWVELFMGEWLKVPTGAFWDQVDAADQYLLKFATAAKTVDVKNGSAVSESAAAAEAHESSDAPWNMHV